MTTRPCILITTLFLLLLGLSSAAHNNEALVKRTRQCVADFASLKKKLDKNPHDIQLQEQAVTTLGEAAYKVSIVDRLDPDIDLDMSQEEKVMICYTYIRLLKQVRPHHKEIQGPAQYATRGGNLPTYDMKLIGAEAQLMYLEFEDELPITIHCLRITRDVLISMGKQRITVAPGLEKYRKLYPLDISDAHRRELLDKVEHLLNAYSADTYYETADMMLNYWLWRDDIKMTPITANYFLETYHFALERAKSLGSRDVDCLPAREEENGGNKAKALSFYRKAANAGSLDGALNAARLLIEGPRRSQDEYKEAWRLLQGVQQHIQFSNKGGDLLLGRMYEQGLGVSQNDSLALDHYVRAFQSMKIRQAIFKNNNYDKKRRDLYSQQLDDLNTDINRLLNRRQINYLKRYAKSIDPKQMSSNGLLMLACRFYFLGEDVSGGYYMELAAQKGSQKAKSILDWHKKSPKEPIIEIINSTFK